MIKKEILPHVSLITGIIAIVALCVGYILQFLFPTPPGHHSSLYSSAGPIIFILSMSSFLFGPIALFTGISGIRQASKGNLSKRKKKIAVVGTILGAAVSSLFLFGTILGVWVL